ncbi:uncharacterized protein [Odocoileus virginianus]|uniref:Uncharacterized protein n=1 Tax=Odocoileus virginianus TaxID=9874 RepID=A0ABM4HXD4_ODOVR
MREEPARQLFLTRGCPGGPICPLGSRRDEKGICKAALPLEVVPGAGLGDRKLEQVEAKEAWQGTGYVDSGPSGAEGRQPGVLGEEEGEKAGRAGGRGPAAGRVPVSPSPSSPPGALVTLRFPPPSSEPQRPPRPALLPFRPHPPARAGPARLAVAPPEAAAAHPCGAAPTRTHGAAGALRVRLRGRRGPGRLGEKGAGKGFRSLGPSWRGDAREDETAAGSGLCCTSSLGHDTIGKTKKAEVPASQQLIPEQVRSVSEPFWIQRGLKQ